MAVCKFCDEDALRWVESERGWRLVYEDGSAHDCRPTRRESVTTTAIDEAFQSGYGLGYTAGELVGREVGREEGRREATWEAFEDGRRQGVQDVTPPAFMRDLLQLCHPDHQPAERAALANRVTARLLALRDGKL